MMFKKYQQLQSSRIDIDFFNLVESSKNTNNYNPQELRCWKNTPKKVQKIPTITILKNTKHLTYFYSSFKKYQQLQSSRIYPSVLLIYLLFKKYQQLQSSRMIKSFPIAILCSKNTNNYNPQE